MASRMSPRQRPWWTDWRLGRRAEALLIGLLILGLMAVTLAVTYRAYVAGLAALSRPSAPTLWVMAPGEVVVILLTGLALGGWLAGAWLGERLGWSGTLVGLLAALLASPIVGWLLDSLTMTVRPNRFRLGDVGPDSLWLASMAALTAALMLGCLLSAWWSSLSAVVAADRSEPEPRG